MWEYSKLMDFIFPRRGTLKKILAGAAIPAYRQAGVAA